MPSQIVKRLYNDRILPQCQKFSWIEFDYHVNSLLCLLWVCQRKIVWGVWNWVVPAYKNNGGLSNNWLATCQCPHQQNMSLMPDHCEHWAFREVCGFACTPRAKCKICKAIAFEPLLKGCGQTHWTLLSLHIATRSMDSNMWLKQTASETSAATCTSRDKTCSEKGYPTVE